MKRPISLLRTLTLALAISLTGSAFADELVITLRNGKTIVLDTAEISSMNFTKSAETIQLIPSPKRFSRGTRPPGHAIASFRPTQGPNGNVAVAVNLTNVKPSNRYDIHLFVNGRSYLGRAISSPITDPTGCAHVATLVQLPPGECVVALSITEHNSEGDIYVTPGIYQNGGTTISIPPTGRPRR